MLKEKKDMTTQNHLQMNNILTLNIPLWLDMPFSKPIKTDYANEGQYGLRSWTAVIIRASYKEEKTDTFYTKNNITILFWMLVL